MHDLTGEGQGSEAMMFPCTSVLVERPTTQRLLEFLATPISAGLSNVSAPAAMSSVLRVEQATHASRAPRG
jgi:hypothetical protein